jgi:hypothetical protein
LPRRSGEKEVNASAGGRLGETLVTMTAGCDRGGIGRPCDRVQIRRLRRAYCGVSGWCSPAAGYAGLIAELRWGWDHLGTERRRRADTALLEAIFAGRIGVALLRGAARLWPGVTARLLARFAPWWLYFLIGASVRSGAVELSLPCCRFAAEGGRMLCLNVCRAPTERFAAALGVPARLDPDLASYRCRWRFGASA